MNKSKQVLGCFVLVLYRVVHVLSRVVARVAFWTTISYKIFETDSSFHLKWRTKEKV